MREKEEEERKLWLYYSLLIFASAKTKLDLNNTENEETKIYFMRFSSVWSWNNIIFFLKVQRAAMKTTMISHSLRISCKKRKNQKFSPTLDTLYFFISDHFMLSLNEQQSLMIFANFSHFLSMLDFSFDASVIRRSRHITAENKKNHTRSLVAFLTSHSLLPQIFSKKIIFFLLFFFLTLSCV